MHSSLRITRAASVVLTVLATLAASVLAATPATAKNRVTPGHFTGYGFDQCVAPTQAAMDTWLRTSPYWAVGIYIAGDNRFCGDDKQVNLDAEWVRTQLRNGWRLLPLTVGLQASCSTRERYKHRRINSNPAKNYSAARAQGRTEARVTVRAAKRLGIAPNSTLWYDLEHFTGGQRCNESALSFLSAWTNKLHALGYRSGVYSSASSGIRIIDEARRLTPKKYALPDQLWTAEWVDAASYRRPPTANPPTFSSAYYDAAGWAGRVMRQYRGGHDESYGGVRINIDTNYLDLGRGSVAPREPKYCGGVNLNHARYRSMSRGDDGAQVKALQCLLRSKRYYRGKLRFHYTKKTERAVMRYQSEHALPANGKATPRTWTSLMSQGPTPIVKIGSAKHAVRRVQRALNAARGARLEVTGVFDHATTRAVRDYQRKRGLRRTGVVAEDTWAQLKAGRR